MPLTLTRLDPDPIPVDFRGATPAEWRADSLAQAQQRFVLHGNRRVSLGELCAVSGDPSDARWRLAGDWSRVNGVGAGMTAGEIVVEGTIGRHAGAGMTGGTLHIQGDAGDWLGAEMRGGLVRVEGDAGDHLGGALPGGRRGMAGGTILVAGSAGDYAAARMRRGLIAIGGDAGDWLAVGMLAGTVLVWGICGTGVAAEMTRGTVLALGPQPALGCTFLPGEATAWPMLRLLQGELVQLGFPQRIPAESLRIFHGDSLRGSRGEVLVTA